MIAVHNLQAGVPEKSAEEFLETLLTGGNFHVERIVSQGHASPAGFWYDQDTHEWALLHSGSAILRFEGQKDPVHLKPGDHLLIPAHVKHRVEWTDPDRDTVWLAVHFRHTSTPLQTRQ